MSCRLKANGFDILPLFFCYSVHMCRLLVSRSKGELDQQSMVLMWFFTFHFKSYHIHTFSIANVHLSFHQIFVIIFVQLSIFIIVLTLLVG